MAASVAALICRAGGESAAQECVAPARFEPPRPTPVSVGNPRARPDHHRLVLAWAPAFCAAHYEDEAARARCIADAPRFVAAGLVPQSRHAAAERDQPRHCIPPMPLSQALLRRNYCLTPSAQYMQDEWVRYGGCAFANAGEFFDRVSQLWHTIRKPDLHDLARRSGGRLSAGQIRRAFVEENRQMGLEPGNVLVSAEPGGRFGGVSICYGEQFTLTPCAGGGAADGVRLRIDLPAR